MRLTRPSSWTYCAHDVRRTIAALAALACAVGLPVAFAPARGEDGVAVQTAAAPTRTAAIQQGAEVKAQAAAKLRPSIVPAAGCGSPGALGVSRVQEIDTALAPKFGHQQPDVTDFLNEGEVVLTFDDGPLRPYTVPVLKALDAHCTKATFFVVGQMAVADPALVKETAARGHTIGTHTWSHKDLRKIGTVRAKGELELGVSAVTKALGAPVAPFFRFPYLSAPKGVVDYAAARKLAVFSIDVDSEDYRTKDPSVVRRNVLNQLQRAGKGIILFHDIQRSTAGALKGLLDELKARGFKVVHVVPKVAALMTQANYDELAEREMQRKARDAKDNPLANRSIVWPIGDGAAGPLPADGAAEGSGDDEVLPWGGRAEKQAAPITPPARRASPAPTPQGLDDWASKIFKF